MDFSLSEEQRLLKESAERFVEKDYPFARRREISEGPDGFDAKMWSTMAELGWLGMPFAEEDGGFGGSPVETMIVMEAIGKGLIVEPFLPTVVLGGGLVSLAGSAEQKKTIIPAVTAGEMRLALAHTEPGARFNLAHVETTAAREGGGFLLGGHKGVVLDGGGADRIIVSARTSGSVRDEAGLTLFVLDRESAGLVIRDYPTVDGLRAAEVELADVAAGTGDVLGPVDGAFPLIEDASERAIAALSAEGVGIMGVLHDDTLEYLKTRQQFGRPIGSFQALQHRMVDMFIEVEQARSMAVMATLRLDEPDADARRRAISAAKVQIGRGGRFVGQQAIQLHGGLGMTDELRISHYFKRLTMIDTQFGNADYHLDRMGAG